MRRLDLNLMQALDALLQTRSVSIAAKQLGVGQPAMSASLARLRALLDDPLLVRGPRGLEPTTRALGLQQQLRAALGTLRDLVATPVGFDPATSDRTFWISGGDYVGMVVLPHLLAALEREAPGVRIRLRYVEKDRLIGCLDDDTLDLAFAVIDTPPARIRSEVALEEDFVLAVRTNHPLLAETVTAERFAAARHLLFTERGDETGAVDQALASIGLSRTVAATVPLVSLVSHILLATDLVVTIGRRAADRITRDGAIACAPLPFAIERWQMQLLSARRRDSDPGLRWLRERCLTLAGGAA